MEALIIGAGALGKSLAGLLAGHASVTICERNLKTRRFLLRDGLVFKEVKRARKIKVKVISNLDELQGKDIDLLILATKIMDLQMAAASAASLTPRWVLLPQNGMFDLRPFKKIFNSSAVCRGVTTMACEESGPDKATLYYRGTMHLGGDGARQVARIFRKCGVEARASRDPESAVWAKLIFSSVMNPLPIIQRTGYQVLQEDKDIWSLVRQAVEEGRAIAGSMGIRLSFDPMKLILRVKNGDLSGIKHRGSIVHDMEAGRRTELDYITGALVLEGRKRGLKTPALDFILSKARSAGAY